MKFPNPGSAILRISLLCGILLLPACDDSPTAPPPFDIDEVEFAPELEVSLAEMQETGSGLYYRIEVEGTGLTAESGDLVILHYAAWLPDGTKFDDSRERGAEAQFVIDQFPDLIDGLQEGVTGMVEGEERLLVIPPALAFGEEGTEAVPPNSAVVLRIELLEVQPQDEPEE